MTTNTNAMTIGHAYYTAIVINNRKPGTLGSFDYVHDMTKIVPESNLVAQKFPLEYNGTCLFVVFPDGSKLAWSERQGFAHPGN